MRADVKRAILVLIVVLLVIAALAWAGYDRWDETPP